MERTDDEEIAQELLRVEAEVAELQGQIDEWKLKDEEACAILTLEVEAAKQRVAISIVQREATQQRVDQMRRERRAVLSWRGITWKGVQTTVRLLLLLCTMLAFLMFITNDAAPGWAFLAALIVDGAAAWFLGDLADYLELTHG